MSPVDTLFEDEFTQPLTENDSAHVAEVKTLPATLDCFTDKMQAEALHRLAYIKWIEQRLPGGWTEKNLSPLLYEAAPFLGEPVPNWRTLVRWHKDYDQHGRKTTALIYKHKNKGNRSNRLQSGDEAFIFDAIKNFLTPLQPSIAHVHQLYVDKINFENSSIVGNKIKAISYRCFCNRIKKLPIYQVINKRNSVFSAKVEFQAIGAHIPPSRILERVEIDHTILDLILLDDELLVPLGRPCLTLLVDAYSRCAVGYNLCFHQPGYESVRSAIFNAIMRKEYVKEKYPLIENAWPCYGKPETLVVDNGVEFWSMSLAEACRELKINIQYNPVRKPWLKPLIERMFGTINRKLLESIPGKTFSNILNRAHYNPQKDAVMRLSTFMEVFHQWLLDVYHCESDTRLRYIPNLAWENSFQMFPPAAIEGKDIADLETKLSISIRRTHRRGGIYLNHLRYDSDEFAFYRGNYPYHSKGKNKVLVKLNPRDISYIFVFMNELQAYLRVPCIDTCGYTTGLNLQQHLINSKLHRDFISQQMDVESLSRVRVYINQRIEREITEVRQSQKHTRIKGINKIAQHQGLGSQACTTIVSDTPGVIKIEDVVLNPNVTPPEADDWDDLISDLDAF